MLSSHLFGFQFAENKDGIQSRILQKHCAKYDALHAQYGEKTPLEWTWLHSLFEATDVRQSYLTPAFVNAAQLIQVNDPRRSNAADPWPYKWLTDLFAPGVYQFNFGDSLIRWEPVGEKINFFFAHKSMANEHIFINADACSLDIGSFPLSYPSDTYQQTGTDLLLQLLVFIYLGPVKFTFLQPKQRYLSRRNPGSLFNKTAKEITIFDAPMYAELIRSGKINWTLYHYPDPASRYGRSLEKRPNTFVVPPVSS